MSKKRTPSIHLVCSRNVCRSAAMAAAFARGAGTHADWRVSSSGLAARDADHMCEVLSAELATDTAMDDFRAGHTPRRTDAALLEDHDLIIVASREIRGRIASIAPQLRSRTFTLREALLLSHDAAGLRSAMGGTSLAAVADALHRRRGHIAVPAPRSLRVFTPRYHALDYPDAHTTPRVPHGTLVRQIIDDATVLQARLSAAMTADDRAHGTGRPRHARLP